MNLRNWYQASPQIKLDIRFSVIFCFVLILLLVTPSCIRLRVHTDKEGDFYLDKVDFSKLKSDSTDYDVYMIGENHNRFRDNVKIYSSAIDYFVNELQGTTVLFELDIGTELLAKLYYKKIHHPKWKEKVELRKVLSLTPAYFDVTYLRRKMDYYDAVGEDIEFSTLDLAKNLEPSLYAIWAILQYNQVPFLGQKRKRLFLLLHDNTFYNTYLKVIYEERELIEFFIDHYRNNPTVYDKHLWANRNTYHKLIEGLDFLFMNYYGKGDLRPSKQNCREDFMFDNFKNIRQTSTASKFLLFNGVLHLAYLNENRYGLDYTLGDLIVDQTNLKVCRIAAFYFDEAKKDLENEFIVPRSLWKFFKKRIKSKYYLYKMGSWETPVPHENPYDYILFVK